LAGVLRQEQAMASAHATTVHEEIRRWAEKHDGRPAKVETGVPGGILRLDFGEKDPNLEEISWDEFFRIFDDNDLALLIPAEPSASEGHERRFNTFVQRPKELKPSRMRRP
jgi:hypothetical protein